jgi:hypothetical protein
MENVYKNLLWSYSKEMYLNTRFRWGGSRTKLGLKKRLSRFRRNVFRMVCSGGNL